MISTKSDHDFDGSLEVSYIDLVGFDQKEVNNYEPNDGSTGYLNELQEIVSQFLFNTPAIENFYISDFEFKIHRDCLDQWGKEEILKRVKEGLGEQILQEAGLADSEIQAIIGAGVVLAATL